MPPSSLNSNMVVLVQICQQSLQCSFRHICNMNNLPSGHLLRHSDQDILCCSIQMFSHIVEWLLNVDVETELTHLIYRRVPRCQWVSSKSGSSITNFGQDELAEFSFDEIKIAIFFANGCKCPLLKVSAAK